MKTIFRCGHQADDGITDGKVRRDTRVCLDCVGEDTETTEIGIWAEGTRITDYDGVFELPKQAITLLKNSGYYTGDVEPEEQK
jgi:hypothetical protein